MMKVLLSGLALFMLTSVTGAKAQDNTQVEKTFGSISAVRNSEVRIPVVLSGVNPSEIKNLTLTVDVDGSKQQMDVNPEMMTTADGSQMFYISVKAPSTTGLSDVSVSVDAINGVQMYAAQNTSAGTIMTVSRKVPHKVVVEEFTALWCPACPSGLVGIERTKLNYGDKVLILAVHNQDPMYCKDYASVLATVMYNPRAMVDRDPAIAQVNPYLGSERGDNGAKYGLGFDIEEQMAIDPVVDIKVGGGMEGKEITVNADITALYSGDANLGVAFVVTQDSLSSENWKQKNSLPIYYRGNEIVEKEPLWDKWINGETEVSGVVYDDVVRIGRSVQNGVNTIIPSVVKEEETYSGSAKFNLEKYSKIKNYDNMNLCAFVIDRNTGKIVNSASVKLSEANAIEGVEAEGTEVVETARYTIGGTRIAVPEKGINIVRYSDGSVKKVMVK